MGLRERLDADLKEAMRRGDDVARRTIRSVKTAISRAETAGEQHITLDDDGIVAVILKEVKQRRESAEEYRKGGRNDLVEAELQELAFLERYLPHQLGPDEIRQEAQAVIAQLSASGPAQMGAVMKALMPKLRGRADGKVVQQVVRDLLNSR